MFSLTWIKGRKLIVLLSKVTFFEHCIIALNPCEMMMLMSAYYFTCEHGASHLPN